MPYSTHSPSDRHSPDAIAETPIGHVGSLAGCWKLTSGHAFTVRATEAGELQIAHGRVWATFDLADADIRVLAGDHFLSRGERVAIKAGQRVVMESYGVGHASSAYFAWQPAAGLDSIARAAHPDRKSGVGIAQPLADLRAAGRLAGSALVQLARGIARGGVGGIASLLTPLAAGFVAARLAPPGRPSVSPAAALHGMHDAASRDHTECSDRRVGWQEAHDRLGPPACPATERFAV